MNTARKLTLCMLYCLIATGPVQKMEAGKGTQFVKAIEDLSPSGGGDCPELAFRGITDALNEGPQSGSPLYVFTDATAKDDHQLDVAKVAAISQGASVYIFLPSEVVTSLRTSHIRILLRKPVVRCLKFPSIAKTSQRCQE